MAKQTTLEIAAEVRSVLAKKQIRQVQVAVGLSLSSMQVSRRLRGEVAFTGEELSSLAELLDVPVTTLFGSPGNAPVESSPQDSAGVSSVTSERRTA
jgi:transcriptional regulator with XRE-family HTH domain